MAVCAGGRVGRCVRGGERGHKGQRLYSGLSVSGELATYVVANSPPPTHTHMHRCTATLLLCPSHNGMRGILCTPMRAVSRSL